MASGMFRFVGALGRSMNAAYTYGSVAMLLLFALGGFVLSRGMIGQNICSKIEVSSCLTLKFLPITKNVRQHQEMDDMGLLAFTFHVRAECHCCK